MQRDLSQEIAIRWNSPDPASVSLLKEGGITVAVTRPLPAFERACAAAGIRVLHEDQIRTLTLEEAGKAQPGEMVVIQSGLWPGTRNPDAALASATRSIWMDQNCYLVRYLQALHPRLPAVLGYRPDADAGVTPGRVVRPDSLELALVEAWVAGGNYLMAMETGYREALLKGVENARAAWQRLGRTAAWLRSHVSLFRQPALPLITVLVDESFMSHEIANLCHRFNVSPRLVAASEPPAPDPESIAVLAAAGIQPPRGDIAARILAHARAGALVVADEPGDKAWWRIPELKLLRTYEDREVYAAGRGQIVAYKEAVSDPGEFALDLLDFAGRDRRPARVWNAQAAVVMAGLAPRQGAVSGEAVLHIVNYGQPANQPVLARIHGTYRRALLLRPEAEAVEVEIAPRGPASEVALPQLGRLATIVFG